MVASFLTEYRTTRTAFWAFFLILSIHLIFYVGTTANPFIQSDAWFFVSHFLMPFYSGDFSFSDLYVIRGAADHVQPLHRILFFINAILFDLDFRYEAVLGALFAVLLAGMMCLHYQKSHNIARLPGDIAVGMLAIVMLVFSLNSTNTFTWSLPALGFMPVFLNVSFFIYLSNRIVKNEGSDLLLITLGMAVLFVGDDVSVLVMIIAGLVLLIAGFVQKQAHIWKYLIVIISMVIVYQLFKGYMVSKDISSGNKTVLLNAVQYYINNWDVIYKVIAAPFADGFFHGMHLRKYPMIKEVISLLLGYSFIFLHLYTWYAFFKYKLYKKSYLPIMLMLYSYALTAGIMVYRVPDFGADYIHQPRYVKTYLIGLWGCLWGLMSLYSLKRETGGKEKLYKKLLYVAVVIVLVVQLVLINHAWTGQKYNIAWQKNHAAKILYYGGDKTLGRPCPETGARFPICKMSPEKREMLIGFLKENKLNVYSERIRKDYLYK